MNDAGFRAVPIRIAIITARGGSKRIPRKNIRAFLGKPLIGWTIENMLASELFDEVCVSTDDQEIAEISTSFGASVPFLRRPELADDFTSTNDVVLDFIEEYEATVSQVAEVCVAYPAAVGFENHHVTRSFEQFVDSQVDLQFVGLRFPSPIERAWVLNENHEARLIHPEFEMTRTQDLAETFYDAGQVYWWREGLAEVVRSGAPLRRGMYEISRNDAVDVDTEDDWAFAEQLFRSRLTSR